MTRVNRRSISVAATIVLAAITAWTWRTYAQEESSAASISAEGNNFAPLIGLPDLIIQSVTVTNEASQGAQISFNDVTKNRQNYCGGSFWDFIYLCTSSNGVSKSCLWTNHFVPVLLGPGGTFSWSGTFTIPSGAQVGTNYLYDVADGSGIIVESNDNNNTNMVMIIIDP
jgi:hypothetical protein